MKVLHIVAGNLNGGAAKGAYCLHTGLRNVGVDSKILTNSSDIIGDPSVTSIGRGKKGKIRNIVRAQLDNLPSKFYKKREDRIFSTGFAGVRLTNHPLYGWADIIHLHWINNGFLSLWQIKKIKKPIVWTLRDMWPMTGGCHYSMSCENYQTGCGHCKQLNSKNSLDLSRFIVFLKAKTYPRSIKCVGISDWMSQIASRSYIFKDYDIRTIHNNIDTDDFFPVNKETAKRVLGIDIQKKTVLVGAQNISAFYKGFDHFLAAIKMLDCEQYHFVFFGEADSHQLKSIRSDFTNFGFLQDLISLRLLYSAADIFVAPSLMEAFGKTIAEAMACGTPVVAFDANGPKDIIDHEINGYLAKPFEPEDLKKGIQWIANHPQPEMLATKARKKIVQCFDVKMISQKYKDLYEEILSETSGNTNDRRLK